ncbi:hypothetical protein [Anaeromusa sp.]|uniref:hypothetical protein n=1 Tax=Anaeromusa sp. TaxID=1872520 RepID=UPI002620622F|nr:hypothetical protein [Anaeromusa sp.]MDD3157273.1 hypothetical protein [Anaeromusa sp.]
MKNGLPFYHQSWFVVVMLFVFFPVGLFLMWRYGSWNSKVKLVISFIFLAAVISNIASPSKPAPPPIALNASASQAPKEIPVPATKRNEDILGDSVKKGLSAFPSMLCTLQSVEINSGVDDTNYVVVNLNAKVGYNKESTLSDFDNSAKYVFKEIYAAKLPIKINNCKIIFNAKFADTKTGKESSDGIYAVGLDNKAASQIHWDKIGNVDISQSVNDRYMHPSLRSMR